MSKEDISSDNQIAFTKELIRKATHMGALIVPGGYYILQLNKLQMLSIMIPVAFIMLFIDLSRLRQWPFWRSFASKFIGPLVRQHESEGDFTGALYILMSFWLTIALFSKPIAIAAISFIIVGDTFAAIVGRKYGKHKFYKSKTLEGSLSCLVGMLLVAILVPDIYLPVVVGGAIVATIFEAYSFGIDDNVTVPLLSGLFMTLFEKVLLFFEFI
ncbi:diacylglycerol/polyprenol kinase family protein [Candidatus Zixiibacteriota bacterium]